MPEVEFSIANSNYKIICGEGEEGKIARLAQSLDSKVKKMSQNFGSASENLILAMTALTMEDEIRSLREKLDHYNKLGGDAKSISEKLEIDEAVAEAIEPVTEYIEMLAKKFENV